MIECVLGSLVGTLIGLCVSAFIVEWKMNKDYKKQLKEFKEAINELTTFKLKFEDVF